MKPIPTKHSGVWMRSRQEARFAEWCDAHKMKWLYEPEGYACDGQAYLPDFYLPEILCFVEVKPLAFIHEAAKMRAMANAADMWNHDFLVVDMSDGFKPLKWYERNDYEDHERRAPHIEDEIAVCWCKKCLSMVLRGDSGWDCRRCGAYDGDHHLFQFHDPHTEKEPQ
jgi:hypothetical protein